MNNWSVKLDYSKRHCWPTTDGNLVDGSSFNNPQYCTQNHPYKTGATEFLRFIREFGELKPGIVTGFPDGFLKFGQYVISSGEFTGISCYCENYGEILKAFLNPNEGWAVVEISAEYPELFDAANNALVLVADSYK